MTIITVKITNKSDHNLQGDLVSVDATYGDDGDSADTVFDDNVGDSISGTITKGRSKSGQYGFAIPKKARGNVTVEVNIDYDHDNAVFIGSVK
jgi:hypothetical protein